MSTRRHELDGGVDEADLRPAVAALAAEDEVRDHRDVVVPRDRRRAGHARGAGADERALERHAGGDDVQEAPDREAGREGECSESRSSSRASIGAFRAEVDPLPVSGSDPSGRTRSRRPCTACRGCRRRGRSPRPSASRRGSGRASRSGSGPRRRSATRPPSRGRACARRRRSGAGTGRGRPLLPRQRPAGTRARGGARGRRRSRSPARIGLGRELGGEERLVDAVPRERVDEAGRVAEQRGAPLRESRARV